MIFFQVLFYVNEVGHFGHSQTTTPEKFIHFLNMQKKNPPASTDLSFTANYMKSFGFFASYYELLIHLN